MPPAPVQMFVIMLAQVVLQGHRNNHVAQPVYAHSGQCPENAGNLVPPAEQRRLLAELEELQSGQGQPGMRLGFLLAAYLTILPATAWKAAESLLNELKFGFDL